MFFDRDNKKKLVPAFFSYVLEFLGEKNKFQLKNCHSYDRYNLSAL